MQDIVSDGRVAVRAHVALLGLSGHGHCVPGTYGVGPCALQPFGHTPTHTKTSKFSGLHVQLGMVGCLGNAGDRSEGINQAPDDC